MIRKELTNVTIVFEKINDANGAPIGHKQIPIQMIFNIKMDFTGKAQLVVGGHVTDPATSSTYSNVVVRDSMRITLTLIALNNCNIEMADVYAPTKEKVYCVLKDEFGPKIEAKQQYLLEPYMD